MTNDGDHAAEAQATIGAEAVAAARMGVGGSDRETIHYDGMAVQSDHVAEAQALEMIVVASSAAAVEATAGTVVVEDNSFSSAIFVGARPADNITQPC